MASLHFARLLRLADMIRGRIARNAKQLARELEVTERTVHRDLDTLRAAGIDCRFDKEAGGYRADAGAFLPPMQLTVGEAMALSVLGVELAGKAQAPLLEDAMRAVMKIRAQLPAVIRDEVAAADRSVKVHTARVSARDADCEKHFETIRLAIDDRRKVRCTYAHGTGDGAGDRKPFLFRPYALYFGQRAWYAVGYSERSRAARTLKLSRLESVEATDLPYAIPDDWSLEKEFGKAWRMMRGDRRYLVMIRFDADHALNVAETLWHPTQTIEWEAGGSCLFRCDVDGLDEIVWWVMGHGPKAEVLGPAELRSLVKGYADEMAGRYVLAGRPERRAGQKV